MRRILLWAAVAAVMAAMMVASALPAAATHPGSCNDAEATAEGLYGGTEWLIDDLYA